MKPLAIIPARVGSKGIPNKNYTPLGEWTPLERAWLCTLAAGFEPRDIIITTDHTCPDVNDDRAIESYLWRPPELAADDTPMIDVVRHVLEQIPGPPGQPIVLLQPTQPLRDPKHITQALALLRTCACGHQHQASLCPGAAVMPAYCDCTGFRGPDSVVSVTQISPAIEWVLVNYAYGDGDSYLEPLADWVSWATFPTRRQDRQPAYKADGTVYAFWRRSVTHPAGLKHGNFYGLWVRPFIIPASESCALDTPEDWAEAERRLREREAQRA